MQENLGMPCSADCICVDLHRVAGELPKMKTIQVALSLNEEGKEAEELFQVEVPEDSTYRDWRAMLRCRFTEIVSERGGRLAAVRFELDGGPVRKKTWGRRLQQFWFELTWRGKPAWASTWLVVWPHVPMPPVQEPPAAH